MRFDSERELEDVICSHFDSSGEVIVDNSAPTYLKRQLNLGDYGIPDLVALYISDPHRHLVFAKIYELKNGPITIDAVSQLCRYRTGLIEAFESLDGYELADVELALVGLSVDSCCHVIQAAGIQCYTAKIDVFEGLVFLDRSEGWTLRDGSFGTSLESYILEVEGDDMPIPDFDSGGRGFE